MAGAKVRGFPAAGGSLDLDVRPGEAVCLSGPSGSGKTSLLRCLAGLDAPLRAAGVEVAGQDPASWPAARLARAIGLVPQEAADGLVGLTVAGEHRFRGRPAPAGPHADQDVATLSSGEARRLMLELSHDRPLLLLDEPVEGLDEAGLGRLRELIARRGQRTVVFVDHDGRLQDLADRRIDLAPAAAGPMPPLPAPSGSVVVRAPQACVRRGDAVLDLPAIAATAGLHLLQGPNGCGKTTLLRRLAGLDDADVEVAGRAPEPGTTTRWSSARARDHLTRSTVEEELESVEPRVAERLVPARLRARHPLHLSGGEAQRVALAKCLGRPAAAYLLDEPEAHLDGAGRAALAQVLAHRIDQGSAIVVASHDPAWHHVAHARTHWGPA